MKHIPTHDIARFREFVAASLGLHFGQDAFDQLAEVFTDRLRKTGCSQPEAYWQRLSSDSDARAELRQLAAELTVPETYFYRHPEQLQAFAETALRDRVMDRSRQQPVRILSAGCASGEEAYSVAAIVHDAFGPAAARDIEILGIDINSVLLEKARRGRYSAWSLRAITEQHTQRHFRTEGREFVLDDALRAAVKFEERNLLDEDGSFWTRGAFDFVFCRNVMIYFARETIQAVVARIAGALAPGGFLFLGSSETLRGVSQEFHLRHTHGAFYYQRRHADEPRVRTLTTTSRSSAKLPPPREPEFKDGSDDFWFGAIGKASQRIAVLAKRSQSQEARRHSGNGLSGAFSGNSAARGWDLAPARELLSQERFSDVIEALQALPPESETDPDVLLLRAVVLTNGGKVGEAEQVCVQVLAVDEMNAGAHYLRALCREHDGDKKSAIEHDQIAIYLDPNFAMPRLHLGLMAQRSGDVETARRELRRALALLSQEDASRILLFGGGFHRESLAQLCQSKLSAC